MSNSENTPFHISEETVPAESFAALVAKNVDNHKLSDNDFRLFIRDTLPIVKGANYKKFTLDFKLMDIADMPNFNPAVPNGTKSVSEGKIYIELTELGYYPWCRKHAAINKVSQDGIWRCTACNEGCYQIKIN